MRNGIAISDWRDSFVVAANMIYFEFSADFPVDRLNDTRLCGVCGSSHRTRTFDAVTDSVPNAMVDIISHIYVWLMTEYA